MKCPYCAHENPSDAERCASCLQKLTAAVVEPSPIAIEASPGMPASKLVCSRCGTTNPSDARICSCCQGQLEPSLALAADTQTHSAQSRATGKVVGCLVTIGVLAGVFFASRELMAPRPRQEAKKTAASAASAVGKDERPSSVPKTLPPAVKVPQADTRAEEQYRLALAWLRRGDQTQARRGLEDVMRKFPGSPYAGRAQAQMERLPPPPDSPGTRREQAISELRSRYRDESSKGKKHATITEDDICGTSKIPTDMKASKVLIPPAPATEAPAAPANQLSLVAATGDGTQLTLRVAYQLGAAHQRPVHAAARVTYPAGNSSFAYGGD